MILCVNAVNIYSMLILTKALLMECPFCNVTSLHYSLSFKPSIHWFDLAKVEADNEIQNNTVLIICPSIILHRCYVPKLKYLLRNVSNIKKIGDY